VGQSRLLEVILEQQLPSRHFSRGTSPPPRRPGRGNRQRPRATPVRGSELNLSEVSDYLSSSGTQKTSAAHRQHRTRRAAALLTRPPVRASPRRSSSRSPSGILKSIITASWTSEYQGSGTDGQPRICGNWGGHQRNCFTTYGAFLSDPLYTNAGHQHDRDTSDEGRLNPPLQDKLPSFFSGREGISSGQARMADEASRDDRRHRRGHAGDDSKQVNGTSPLRSDPTVLNNGSAGNTPTTR
jgi:hypothetical protein